MERVVITGMGTVNPLLTVGKLENAINGVSCGPITLLTLQRECTFAAK
jgi:hypothetical protein